MNSYAPGQPLSVRLIRWFVFLEVVAIAILYVQFSWHWRLMVDSPIMHYVVYLMHHGLRPWIDISDNNMPGSYITEAAAMRLFGPTDLAWRIYEFTLLALLAASLALIAKTTDWLAGLFAAGVFTALHAAEGPNYAGERELVIATLLAMAIAALFSSVRHRAPALALLFGLASGLATSIKPTFLLLPAAILLLTALHLHRQRQPWLSTLFWAAAGAVLIGLLDLAYIVHYEALGAFLFLLRHVLPSYAALGSNSLLQIARGALPRPILLLILLALPLAWLQHRHKPITAERLVLLLTALYGLFSYMAQRKGFLHHRYVTEIFLLLLIGLELLPALRLPGWPRGLAIVALVFALFFYVPKTLYAGRHVATGAQMELAVEHDFLALDAPHTLQRRILCLDLVYGCLDALYHLDIVEDTGFTGDLLFFAPKETAAVRYYRQQYAQQTANHPPELIMLSNQELMHENNFTRVLNWPVMDAELRQHYTLIVERHFLHEHFGSTMPEAVPPVDQDAYRLYLRNGSPLFPLAAPLVHTLAPGQTPPVIP